MILHEEVKATTIFRLVAVAELLAPSPGASEGPADIRKCIEGGLFATGFTPLRTRLEASGSSGADEAGGGDKAKDVGEMHGEVSVIDMIR